METVKDIHPIAWIAAAWIGINLLLIAWSWRRYRRSQRFLQAVTINANETRIHLERDCREAEAERIMAQARDRDARATLAVERQRVDHLIGVAQLTARHAARTAQPFPDFGSEPAGVRAADRVRRGIEDVAHMVKAGSAGA